MQDGDLAVGEEAVAGGVVGIGREPGAGNHIDALDAAGEIEVVDDLGSLVVDVLVDDVDEGLLLP